ncbi:hypothetical protein CBM2586_B20024 [Cupriavidus phytorum]|uniref:Uncharacterized protein n=1 Tax=Cupriavidus taiwanensis TaxID=164546 RepID=A0A375CJY7_9BURK|nr:hypothetical protein CBM2586_B20024 [Cupriavidus taiwanensis]
MPQLRNIFVMYAIVNLDQSIVTK